MVDWSGSSRRTREFAEQLVALRDEIASIRKERTQGLAVEAEQRVSIAALRQSVDELRNRIGVIASEVSDIRDKVAVLNCDAEHRQTIEEERTRVELTVLKLEKRLQLHAEHATKTATALFERIELLRRPQIYDPDRV